MKFIKSPLIILFLFLNSTFGQNVIKDIIKPVNLIAGKMDSVLITDMFYSTDYSAKFDTNKYIEVNYNKSSGIIYFKTDKNFSGLTLVDFNLGSKKYSILVRSRVQQKFKFKFKPEKKYNTLTLFGSFNGWNRRNIPMKDDNGDGIFETEITLEPGRYEYKFYGDGEEIVDPNNPDKKSNGFGDFNSLFNVPEQNLGKLFLHTGSQKISGNKSIFTFIYENDKDGNDIKPENVIALLDNQKLDHKYISTNKNVVKFSISTGGRQALNSQFKSKNLLRVAINKNGSATNIQSVNIINGKPAGNDNFEWNDGIIYSLMIDRFSDGNKKINKPIIHDSLFAKANYMGGDFQGIINKINEGYFDSLGINTLWISPVNDNPDQAYKESPAPHRWYSGYHGYWPISSYDVEDQFGTMKKLKELISTAHKHKIKVLLDFVANHVHQDHPIFKQHPDWFGNLILPDGRKNLRLWDEQRLTTWFEPYLPKFNFVGSKQVIDFMTSNAVWWLKQTNADGFRQDAVKHITNEFWRELTKKNKKEIEPDRRISIFQIGETFGSYELINSYVNNGQLSAQFNFNLYDTALPTFLDKKTSFQVLDSELKKSFLVYGENNLMGNIMDSHDKNRFMAFADGDLDISQWSASEVGWNNPPAVDNPANYNKAKLYYAYMNTIPGLPVIYYGSEFGMSGASDPDNRRMMRFGSELSKNERNMLEDVRKIINTRKNHPALRYGDFLTLIADESIYAYIRSDMNERILIALNKNENPRKLKLEVPQFYNIKTAVNLVGNEEVNIANNKLEIELDGIGYKILLLK